MDSFSKVGHATKRARMERRMSEHELDIDFKHT